MIDAAPPGNFIRRRPSVLGLYVHFPYCVHKCDYCDFFSIGTGEKSVSKPLLSQFEEALFREFDSRLQQFRRFEKVNTIYFGGGTSSLMPPELVRRILQRFQSEFAFTSDCEITLEGNPESMDADYLAGLAETGITRVNTGIQTFDPGLLDSVHRLYDHDRYAKILSDLRNCRIPDRGVDLIYGFPGQRLSDFEKDLDRVLEADLSHLSIYSLTVEAGTQYAKSIREGKARAPQEELAAEIFDHLPGLLKDRGYSLYEISNYARPGRECRHNLRYWLCEPCLALGPGAHGTDGRMRYGNLRNISAWAADPAGARQIPVDPPAEVPISLLRLALPFDPAIVSEIGLENSLHLSAADLFDKWVELRYAQWVLPDDLTNRSRVVVGGSYAADARQNPGRLFKWTMDGLRFLDDRILEMAEVLEKTPAASEG